MHWGWKLGFGLLLAAAIVAYTDALISQDSPWTLRSARWLSAIVLLIVGMGIVTYFYSLQVDAGQSDETGTVSRVQPPDSQSQVV
jgi:nitric oxide reductase large subunit